VLRIAEVRSKKKQELRLVKVSVSTLAIHEKNTRSLEGAGCVNSRKLDHFSPQLIVTFVLPDSSLNDRFPGSLNFCKMLRIQAVGFSWVTSGVVTL
jgi:hypothetical protein